MARSVQCRAQSRHVAGDATGGVGVYRKHRHNLVRRVVTQRLFHHLGIDRKAFDPRRAHDLAAHGFGLYRPRIGEVAGTGHQHRLARRNQVGDDRLPRAMPIGTVDEHFGGFCLQQALEPALHRRNGLVEPRVGHIHRLAAHGVHHGFGHMRGAGGMEKADSRNSGGFSHGRSG